MTYSLRYRIPAPIAMYDAMHAVVKDVPGSEVGLMVHLGWETDEGFNIIEVWESKEAYDKFIQDVAPEVVARLGQGPVDAPQGEEFNLRGLVIPKTSAVFI